MRGRSHAAIDQQFRSEKDWHTLFGMVTIVNEGVLMWLLVGHSTLVVPEHVRPSLAAFTVQFVVIWLAFWIVVNGPMHGVIHGWRFAGGRFS